jgi:hypothetical protein
MTLRPGLLIVCLTWGALVDCSYGPAFDNSHEAVKLMRVLIEAEIEYRHQHGRYGDLSLLGPAGANLITTALASGRSNGYEFHVNATDYRFSATAWPLVENKTGFRSLYCDESGVIRGTWDRRATAMSPPINPIK